MKTIKLAELKGEQQAKVFRQIHAVAQTYDQAYLGHNGPGLGITLFLACEGIARLSGLDYDEVSDELWAQIVAMRDHGCRVNLAYVASESETRPFITVSGSLWRDTSEGEVEAEPAPPHAHYFRPGMLPRLPIVLE